MGCRYYLKSEFSETSQWKVHNNIFLLVVIIPGVSQKMDPKRMINISGKKKYSTIIISKTKYITHYCWKQTKTYWSSSISLK